MVFKHTQFYKYKQLRKVIDKEGKLAVIALELRNLKRIKETNGEDVADRYLKICAERISEKIHGSNIIARYDDNRLIISFSHFDEQIELTNALHGLSDVISAPLEIEGDTYYPII